MNTRRALDIALCRTKDSSRAQKLNDAKFIGHGPTSTTVQHWERRRTISGFSKKMTSNQMKSLHAPWLRWLGKVERVRDLVQNRRSECDLLRYLIVPSRERRARALGEYTD